MQLGIANRTCGRRETSPDGVACWTTPSQGWSESRKRWRVLLRNSGRSRLQQLPSARSDPMGQSSDKPF